MSDTKIYVVQFNGESHLIEAETITAVRAKVLAEVGFEARFAKANEVARHMANGGRLLVAINADSSEAA